jgi:hypothetical protein
MPSARLPINECSDFRQFPAHSRQIELQSETVNDHKVSRLKAIWNLWVGIAVITCLRQVEMT